ncbi:MAG: hypothetical protein RIR88_305, partial [Actinomycetota bacterium]
QDAPPVTKPPFISSTQANPVTAPLPKQAPPTSGQPTVQPSQALPNIDVNDPAFASLPLTERLRIQAQARAKQGDGDQNVGPVK